MQTTQKIIELLSKNYLPNITILGDFLISKYTSILDSNNGTIFIISDNTLFYFKDQDGNHWLTIITSFHLNGNEYKPKLGDLYIQNDGIKYSFTSREEVVAMAIAYFEQHILFKHKLQENIVSK